MLLGVYFWSESFDELFGTLFIAVSSWELSCVQTPLPLKPELRSSDLHLITFSVLTERKTTAHYAVRANSC